MIIIAAMKNSKVKIDHKFVSTVDYDKNCANFIPRSYVNL